ncbi:MAG TPA: hypothetical protein VM431_11965 [Phycisphaerae bacterium]|nr:hypothetical protein [Phycisphaerae bacterium]HUU11237.1 hypothetical protein [Phycisphaerae bacterium]
MRRMNRWALALAGLALAGAVAFLRADSEEANAGKHSRALLVTTAGVAVDPAMESGGNLAAAATSLAAIDDWDETDRCKIVPSSGLPVYGVDATGADAYATVATSPARVCHYLHVSVADNGAVVSLDGGTTDHFAMPPNTERLFEGLATTSAVAIQGKNLSAGNNYTNLRISVW